VCITRVTTGIVIPNVSWSQTNTLNVTVGQHSFGTGSLYLSSLPLSADGGNDQ
jgi:hypothetical protein